MVGNVTHSLGAFFPTPRHHEGIVALIDLDGNTKGGTKGHNLHVIAIGATLSHTLEMRVENTVDLFRRWCRRVSRCREGAGGLAFWISTNATADIDIDELFVVASMLSHIVYDLCSDHVVVVLVPIELVRKSVEEAVAFLKRTC